MLNFLKLNNICYGTSISYEPLRFIASFVFRSENYHIIKHDDLYIIRHNGKRYEGTLDYSIEILTKLFDRELIT